jgi:hypothetical protein
MLKEAFTMRRTTMRSRKAAAAARAAAPVGGDEAAEKLSEIDAGTKRTAWKVDSEGYYERDRKGTYVPKAERKEKASFEEIENLLRANTAEKLSKIFDPAAVAAAAEKYNGE